MKLICYLTTLSNIIFKGFVLGNYISGHDYIEQDNGDLKCDRCGHISKG
jgi:hypothetical protein